jgi:tRNA/rRNA methyltransferase
LNIGAVARAMSNFGFLELRLVQPYDKAWQEARSAVGAAKVLAATQVYDTVQEAVADCSLVVGTASLGHRDLRLTVRRLEYGGRILKRHLASESAALLFGSEKFGLSNDDLSLCHWLLRIPTREEHESMNLGQAVAVCLYELVRNPKAPHAEQKRGTGLATAGELEIMERLMDELLLVSEFTHERKATSSRLKLRRFLRRMALSGQDVHVWYGMLRQFLWKMKGPNSSGSGAE